MLLLVSEVVGQRWVLLEQSKFRHSYVVSQLRYVEDLADTSRLKYIATARIIDSPTITLQGAEWFDLLEIKAKQLGANAYHVVSFVEDSIGTGVDMRLYFATEKFIEANAKKRLTCGAFFFNQVRIKGDSGDFYVNNQRICFDSRKHYHLEAEPGREYIIRNKSNSGLSKSIIFSKTEEAEFLVVPGDVKYLRRPELGLNSTYVTIGGVRVNLAKHVVFKLRYELGRFLLAMYR